MELFMKTKNYLFQLMQEVISQLVVNGNVGIDEKQMAKKYASYSSGVELERFLKEMLKGESNLLEKKEKSIFLKITWEKLDFGLSDLERAYLYQLAKDPLASLFLSDELVEKLSKSGKEETLVFKEALILRNYTTSNYQYEKKIVQTILDAMVKKKKICYTNETRQKMFKNCVASPIKFYFSLRSRRLQLILKPEGVERVVLVNVDTLCEVEVLEDDADKELEKYIAARKKTMKLEVRDKNTSVERCFLTFSHLDKEASYDKKRKIHSLRIIYYDFDESDIIRDLLMLGSGVEVMEPPKLRQKIMDEIRIVFAMEK